MSSFLATYLCIYIDLLYYHVRRYHDITKPTSVLRWNEADILAWNYTCHWTKGTKPIPLKTRSERMCSGRVTNSWSSGTSRVTGDKSWTRKKDGVVITTNRKMSWNNLIFLWICIMCYYVFDTNSGFNTNIAVRAEVNMLPFESFMIIKTQTIMYLVILNNEQCNHLLHEVPVYNLTKIVSTQGTYSWYTYAKNVSGEIGIDVKITGM